jgi:hypothetical protein
MLAPDECQSDLPITHRRCRYTQDRAGRTGTQTDARHADSWHKIHAARTGIGAGDHELAPGQPDQVNKPSGTTSWTRPSTGSFSHRHATTGSSPTGGRYSR